MRITNVDFLNINSLTIGRHLSYLAQCANFETSEAAQEITASVTELKSALNGVAIKAVGAELEPPKVYGYRFLFTLL